jgi:hypothetical protein
MQLKLKRSQRSAGLMGGKIVFGLNARLELTTDEGELVQKYKLGKQSIYDSENRRKHLAEAHAHMEVSEMLPSRGSSFAHFGKGLLSAAMAGLSLKVTIDSLSSGQQIECKDLDELIAAEVAILQACNSVKTYLVTAQTFDGREEIVGF